MLEVAGGIKTQWETHSKPCSLAGTVVASWDGTRETGEPDDTWRWEKSWGTTDPDADSLGTGQRGKLCEKLDAF